MGPTPERSLGLGIGRIALLSLAPALSVFVGSQDMLAFAAFSSVLAAVIDFLRQRRKWLPFPVYLLVVYALQTSYCVAFGFQSHQSELPAEIPPLPVEPQLVEPATIKTMVEPATIKTMSIVMAAHNEQVYLKRTLRSIFERTPSSILKEVIIVDDGSNPPLAEVLKEFANVTLLRHEERRGLIKSKTEGGNLATSDMIMFLDAHVKPEPHWAEPLLEQLNINYKRVVVPLIPILDGDTWETDMRAVGVKMMFDWTLHFQWFEDNNDVVPCMSGGLFGITRQWWHESGEYDYEMQMWGAENIEQSIRVWLCGGEIYVVRNSKVAHVFRSKFPYTINNTQIYLNKVRTVETWFDEYKERYYGADPAARQFVPFMGDLAKRQALKTKLQCKPFKWYVQKFRKVFNDKYMLDTETYLIRDRRYNMCIQVTKDGQHLEEAECKQEERRQQFSYGNGGYALRNIDTGKCLDANAGVQDKAGSDAFLYHCYGLSEMQKWSLRRGQVRWENMCLKGARAGRMKLGACNFLGSNEFEKMTVAASASMVPSVQR